MNDQVLTAHDGPVTTITLNRAKRHNSLTPQFLAALLKTLAEVPQTTRALVLRANGRSFSTGGDMRGFYENLDDLERYAQQIVGLLNQVLLAMVDLDVPLVTAVQGIVTGGSVGFILASDIVLVAPEVSFTPYYSVVGFSPDGGWSAWLAAMIGERRAAESLLCNRSITAEEAVAWGLATRLVDKAHIQAEARQIADLIGTMKAGSIRHTRQLLGANRSFIADLLDQERQHFVAQIVTAEARQGIMEFVAGSGAKP